MATPTYDLLASTTLTTAVTNLTFSSIPQTHGDLVIVTSGTFGGGSGISFQLNDDTGSNYSMVATGGNPYNTFSNTDTSFRLAYYTISGQSVCIGQLMNYSNTTQHKTMLARGSSATTSVQMIASRWASTAAVTKIKIINAAGENFSVGHTFNIYGIAKTVV